MSPCVSPARENRSGKGDSESIIGVWSTPEFCSSKQDLSVVRLNRTPVVSTVIFVTRFAGNLDALSFLFLDSSNRISLWNFARPRRCAIQSRGNNKRNLFRTIHAERLRFASINPQAHSFPLLVKEVTRSECIPSKCRGQGGLNRRTEGKHKTPLTVISVVLCHNVVHNVGHNRHGVG